MTAGPAFVSVASSPHNLRLPAFHPAAPDPFLCAESVAPYRHCRPGADVARRSSRETALHRCDDLAMSVRAALERIVPPLARAASAFLQAGAWRYFGHARAGDHARERFGRSGRWLRDLAALGEAFQKLPGLADAVTGADGGGSIGRVAASIIARVAANESLPAWVQVARAVPVRELRELSACARREGSIWPPRPSLESARSELENTSADGGSGPASLDSARAALDRAAPPLSDHLEDNDGVEGDERALVRLMVPAAVAVAFDETLDLYRALAGSNATVAEFVEALVADAQAGPHPVDAQSAPYGSAAGARPGDDPFIRALREKALARSTENWKHLSNEAAASGWAFALAGMSLAALEDLRAHAGSGGPAELDAQIRALIGLENELERRLAQLLADMAEQNAWARLRFDGVGHYAEQRLGMSRSAAQDRVRAHRGLARLPVVRAAYMRGDIGLDAALVLVRILERGECADGQAQQAWVSRARHASSKRLHDEERLMGRLRAIGSRDMPPDDGAWQRSLRRERGTARRRIAAFGGRALEDPVGDTFFRLRLPRDLASAFLSCVESTRARLARVVEQVPWDQPWPDELDGSVPASLRCARMFSIRCRRAPAWVGLLAMLEEFAQTWDDPAMSPDRSGDAVYIRDGWRCGAPGCSSRRNLESHHIVYRSRGGSDELSNLTCLCRFHHQMGEHGGLASCSGVAPLGILWSLGREGVGGRWRNEIRV